MHFDEFVCKELARGAQERLLLLFLARRDSRWEPVSTMQRPLDRDLSFIGLEDATLGPSANWDCVVVVPVSDTDGRMPSPEACELRLQEMVDRLGSEVQPTLDDHLRFDHSGEKVEA